MPSCAQAQLESHLAGLMLRARIASRRIRPVAHTLVGLPVQPRRGVEIVRSAHPQCRSVLEGDSPNQRL